MNIGARLQAIGELVPDGVKIADIGTDHAYLPVWLVDQKKVNFAVAGDIASGPCKAASNTVAMYGLKDKIEVRLGSGLSIVMPGEVDIAIIAGMGATTIIDILKADVAVTNGLKQLIVQPMAGAGVLRQWANSNGWCIVKEVLVREGKHLYEIIVFEHGQEKACSKTVYEVGPYLLATKPILLKEQFAKLKQHYSDLISNMERSETARSSEKYCQFKEVLSELEVLESECYSK